MNKSKKLFNSEDFDKKKPLFGPEDFDKSGNDSSSPHPVEKFRKAKIIGGIVAAAVIISGGIFFFINNKESEGGNDGTPTEVIAQNTENQNEGNDAPAAETSNEDVSAESKGVPANTSEAPAAENTDESPANTTSSANPAKANDNQVAERPAKRNPATIAEPVKPVQSKPAATQTTKPFSVTSAPVSGDVEENARRVIRGDFGNGQERRDKLGSSYSEIQGKVNEMYRQGIVN
ncbi:hypothetical protein [uncultured Prevotella sp.]|uniref:hypothetical protein n=1 Tax=uncultured Prevotella sp. TaxID=159272 RepID=UPI0027DDD53C|nr:hypothetical protein [uncultured Prevotella sp.]